MKRNNGSNFRRSRRVLCTFLFAAAIAATIGAVTSSRAVSGTESHGQAAAMSKIAPWVLDHTANGQQAEFNVVLADQADLHAAAALRTKQEKGRYVYDTLWNKAQATQGPLLQWLREHKIEYRSFYIVNMVWVKGNADIALQLAARPDVARVEGNPVIHNNFPKPASQAAAPVQPNTTDTIEQGIAYSHAPEVWALGFTGQGIVVAGADTGFRWDHNAIKPHYRGWNGTTVDHDYNWHDSVHTGGGICGPDSPQPCDDFGHGTHTLGTAVGDDGAGNQIGMAPGAECMGCRNMDQGNGTPARYIECFEFFLAPYPVGGNSGDGDPTKAPDLSTNSWECPASEGCSAETLLAAIQAQRAAGIMPVVAAQNAGPGCSTVLNPPGIYDEAYSIGALNNGTDTIASFSSRGPVTADGSNRLKPDLSAPGTNVRSAWNSSTSSYEVLSGTSMATPHVAGAVALVWSAHPELRNDIDATETVLNTSAVHILNSSCDGGGPPVSPNNTYGYGRMDALAAVQQQGVLQLTAAVSRKVQGSAGTFDVVLPLSGEPGVECRSGNGRYTFVFTFSSDVVSGSAAVTGGIGTVHGNPVFSGNTMTVNLASVSDVQEITLTLSNVTSSTSQVLPDTAVSANILVGDVTGDKTVDNSDLRQTKRDVGNPVTSSNFREDVKVNGAITAADVRVIRSDIGHTLP